MKKKLILIASLVFAFCCLFAFSVNAACAECEDDWTLVFGSKGYLGEITAVNTCPVCGTVSNETIGPLFETLGYSYSEMGGITQRYAVNKAAVARYNEITGTTLKFGAVTAVASNVSGTDVVDKDGNPVGNFALTADLTRRDYDLFNVTVANIPEAYWGEGIICSAYVIAGDYISYINDGVEKQGFVANSLNAVKDLVDNPVAAELPEKIVTLKNGARTELNTVALTPEQLGLGVGGYWNSTSSVNHKYLTVTSVDGDVASKYAYTSMLTKENLPVGSLIVIEDGWSHRANGWTNKCIASYRPEPVNAAYTVATESWWGEHTTKAFNINSGSLILTDKTVSDIDAIFKIYVPVGAVIPDAPEAPELPKPHWSEDGSLKILTIGNSFSDDAMEYVYYIAKQAGITDVELGNIRRDKCSLANHLEFFGVDNQYAYRHWVNGAEGWDHNWDNDTSIQAVLDDGVAWDFIVFQQVSTSSTDPSTYDDVYKLIELVKPYCPTAKLAWHMTWANKSDDGTAYAQILNAVQTKILTNGEIDVVIPTGTAIENAKTSYLVSNDIIYRPDGKHLSYGLGRYIAGLTFVKTLTGYSINSIAAPEADTEGNSLTTGYESAMPSFAFDEDINSVCIESASNAANTKFNPIKSKIVSVKGMVTIEYLGYTKYSYYNKNAGEFYFEPLSSEKVTSTGTIYDYVRYFSTKMFTREMLPVGSVIEVESGYQYFVEGWELDENGTPIPGTGAFNSRFSATGTADNYDASAFVGDYRILVTEEWWGNNDIVAFNVGTPFTPLDGVDDARMAEIFKIYVREAETVAKNAEGAVDENGVLYDPTPYDKPAYAPVELMVTKDGKAKKDVIDFTTGTIINGKLHYAIEFEELKYRGGFYNAFDNIEGTHSNSWQNSLHTTIRILTPDELLNGFVIWSDVNYKAESWIKKGYQFNTWGNAVYPTGNRSNYYDPSKHGNYVTITDEWWYMIPDNTYNFVDYDESLDPVYKETDVNIKFGARGLYFKWNGRDKLSEAYDHFRIYVPVDMIEGYEEGFNYEELASDKITVDATSATVTVNKADLAESYVVSTGLDYTSVETDAAIVYTITLDEGVTLTEEQIRTKFKLFNYVANQTE